MGGDAKAHKEGDEGGGQPEDRQPDRPPMAPDDGDQEHDDHRHRGDDQEGKERGKIGGLHHPLPKATAV
ncbi:MAG: hypothetical protein MPW16_03920 [Candidatus Manganitrophus sp.]|nr:MAG: hypothetical protein MPW16_03920 [Candidatus Manganitrophus sp.]